MSTEPPPAEPAAPVASTSAADPPPPPPNPLDGLSHADLRKKLDNSRKDLKAALDKKKRLDKELAALEYSIHAFEGSYLSDALLPPSTAAGNANTQFGNIIKGYDSYLKAAAAGGDRKRGRGNEEPRDSDRMFSRSSATYQKALELKSSETPLMGNGIPQTNAAVAAAADSGSEEESMGSTGPGRKRRR